MSRVRFGSDLVNKPVFQHSYFGRYVLKVPFYDALVNGRSGILG